MIPADLLDKLREKDPELWERMRRMPIYVHRDSSLTVDLTKSDNTELVDAWLQHCLQESIRARGWYYSIWNTSPDSTEVIIRRGGEGYINPDFMHIGEGKNEAEALLIAYLAAV